ALCGVRSYVVALAKAHKFHRVASNEDHIRFGTRVGSDLRRATGRPDHVRFPVSLSICPGASPRRSVGRRPRPVSWPTALSYGAAQTTLLRLAPELLVIARRIDVSGARMVAA
ncbi:MAG: hypothetical protein MZV63_55895, partial [Marinilabiliales bacterium]|nr:hypothetical protein [Marinilabiliales bacterium]